MRYQLMASFQGLAFEAALGPTDEDVVLFAAAPPGEGFQFEHAGGLWRAQVRRSELDALWESRPAGRYRGHGCLVLDDLGDRLHIAFSGHDAYDAEQLGYWQVDRGVYEVVVPRWDVTDLTDLRNDYPTRRAESAGLNGPPATAPPGPGTPPPGMMTTAPRPTPADKGPARAARAALHAPAPTAATPGLMAAGAEDASGTGSVPQEASSQAPSGPGPAGPMPADSVASLATQPQRPMTTRPAGPGGSGPQHAAPQNAGPQDARPQGPGPQDAGPQDAGPQDAGPQDAGPQDAGSQYLPQRNSGPQHALPQRTGPHHTGPQHGVRQQAAPPDTPAPDPAGTAQVPSAAQRTWDTAPTAETGPAGAGAGTRAAPGGGQPGQPSPASGRRTFSLPADMMAPAPPREPLANGTGGWRPLSPGPGDPGSPGSGPASPGADGTGPGAGWNDDGRPAPAGPPGADGLAGAMAALTPDPLTPDPPTPDPPTADPAHHNGTYSAFRDLVGLAAIPDRSFAVDEDVDGARCLVRTDDGFEVYSSAGDQKHEVRFFLDEESAYFYLFGVLAADALRAGLLIRREG